MQLRKATPHPELVTSIGHLYTNRLIARDIYGTVIDDHDPTTRVFYIVYSKLLNA